MSNLQWIRKATLVVSSGTKESGGPGIDLSDMRIRFRIESAGTETPDSLWARVYNIKPETLRLAEKEYTRVTLQAGYENGESGVIFDGTVRMYGSGREDGTTTYFDIFASDGDAIYNAGVINQTVARGATQKDVMTRVAEGMGGTLDASSLPGTGGVLPRGRVLFGMGRAAMRSLSQTLDCSWRIENGKVIIQPLADPLDGEPIAINQETGMIGVPEQTIDGIRVRALLNPRFRIGGKVTLNNKDVAQQMFTAADKGHVAYNRRAGAPVYLANVARGDGLYSVFVIDHIGDTRGEEWFSDLTLLAIDPVSQKITAT